MFEKWTTEALIKREESRRLQAHVKRVREADLEKRAVQFYLTCANDFNLEKIDKGIIEHKGVQYYSAEAHCKKSQEIINQGLEDYQKPSEWATAEQILEELAGETTPETADLTANMISNIERNHLNTNVFRCANGGALVRNEEGKWVWKEHYNG